MTKQVISTLNHCAYSLHDHLVLITKYRRKCLAADILNDAKRMIEKQISDYHGELLEFNGEADHIHMLMALPPTIAVSTLVNVLKSMTSRKLREKYDAHLKCYYWKPYLWSRCYFVASCGGAPLSVIEQYIRQQESPL